MASLSSAKKHVKAKLDVPQTEKEDRKVESAELQLWAEVVSGRSRARRENPGT